MVKKRKRRKTLTRGDWLLAAMDTLKTQGVGGVRILTLAKALGVTRGSFYWHFRNRQDLLVGMLEWWERELTDTVITYVEGIRGNPTKRIQALAERVVRLDLSHYDVFVRAWASADPRVSGTVRRVTRKRHVFVEGLFRDAGFPAAEARARGSLLAVYLQGEPGILGDLPMAARLRLVRRHLRLLLSKE